MTSEMTSESDRGPHIAERYYGPFRRRILTPPTLPRRLFDPSTLPIRSAKCGPRSVSSDFRWVSPKIPGNSVSVEHRDRVTSRMTFKIGIDPTTPPFGTTGLNLTGTTTGGRRSALRSCNVSSQSDDTLHDLQIMHVVQLAQRDAEPLACGIMFLLRSFCGFPSGVFKRLRSVTMRYRPATTAIAFVVACGFRAFTNHRRRSC